MRPRGTEQHVSVFTNVKCQIERLTPRHERPDAPFCRPEERPGRIKKQIYSLFHEVSKYVKFDCYTYLINLRSEFQIDKLHSFANINVKFAYSTQYMHNNTEKFYSKTDMWRRRRRRNKKKQVKI